MNTFFYYVRYLRAKYRAVIAVVSFAALLPVCWVGYSVWSYFCVEPEILTATWAKDHRAAFSLLDRGADVNVTDDRGRTPLMWAANLNDYVLVQAYLQHGANINQRDSHGRTALTWAGYAYSKPIADLLKKAGATP